MNVVVTVAVYTRLPVPNLASDLISDHAYQLDRPATKDAGVCFGNILEGTPTFLHLAGDTGRLVEPARAEIREPSSAAAC